MTETKDEGKYLALAEVRDLIQAAIAEAVKPLQDQVAKLEAECVRYEQWVALRASGPTPELGNGQVLSAEAGGPTEGDRFVLRGRPHVSAWESWKIHRGAW